MKNYFVWATPSSMFAVVDLKVPNMVNFVLAANVRNTEAPLLRTKRNMFLSDEEPNAWHVRLYYEILSLSAVRQAFSISICIWTLHYASTQHTTFIRLIILYLDLYFNTAYAAHKIKIVFTQNIIDTLDIFLGLPKQTKTIGKPNKNSCQQCVKTNRSKPCKNNFTDHKQKLCFLRSKTNDPKA